MSILAILAIVWIHYLADFLCQTRWMAENKSKSNQALGAHIAVYTAWLFLFFGPLFAIVNGTIHFLVDYNTSRVTSKLYKQKKYGPFFAVIGLDQAIHFTCLFVTYAWIGGWGG